MPAPPLAVKYLVRLPILVQTCAIQCSRTSWMGRPATVAGNVPMGSVKVPPLAKKSRVGSTATRH
jgi:hypothetical protein